MSTTTAVMGSVSRPARHFDRGFRCAFWSTLPAAVLLVACSGSLNTSDPGSGGTGGGGDAGGAGSECGGLSGAGNCVLTGEAGTSGTTGIGGTTGSGGSGGSLPLPACTVGGPGFGVCAVNDAEARPTTTNAHTSGAATIEAVGSGAAPVVCPTERVIGVGGPSNWWFQARAADNRLWTISVLGLAGSMPIVRTGDVVTLDLDWRASVLIQGGDSTGQMRLADATGTPLLWAGAKYNSGPDDPTWISFAGGDYVCGSADPACDERQGNVIATVNGSSMTLPPHGAASIGGYFVQVTYFPRNPCWDIQRAFRAAAAKISAVTTP